MVVIARVFLILMALLAGFALPSHAEAAGPWKGRIVDKETGQPIEGAVVLARWEKRYASFVGEMAGNEYYDSEEVITDAEGRFVIQARATWTLNPFSEIYGPEFFIFKSGYGKWQFRDFDKWGLKDAMVSAERTRAEWRKFTAEGAVLELPRTKTRDHRIQAMQIPIGVPYHRMPIFLEAINTERITLGLEPYRKGNQRQGYLMKQVRGDLAFSMTCA